MSTMKVRLTDWHKKFMVEERYVPADLRRKVYLTAYILMGVGLACFIAILLQVITNTGIVHVDHQVEAWFDRHRVASVTPFMVTMAIVFGPTLLPIFIAIIVIFWFITARHVWRPLLLSCFMVFGVIIVETIAHLVGRTRPPLGMMLLSPDHTFSFPSGHVMGTADFLALTSYLLVSRKPTRTRIIIASIVVFVGVALQIISRMYLGYHWLSDTLASVSLALFVFGLMMAVDTWRTVRVPGEQITGEHSVRQTEGS